MIGAPVPVILQPIFKPKPWGGRELERLFQKPLPPGQPIGESWEVADLPGDVTHVRCGPLEGAPLSELLRNWGADLLGHALPVNGRFPLLIKFLDAREALSVQVHPRPSTPEGDRTPGIKHEAWYVLDAAAGATILAGIAPGIDPERLVRCASTSAVVGCLQSWTVTPGECYYLPSGTLHALGGGVVVAEVQTPSDVTYRLYDWGRTNEAGRPRELHMAAAIQNTRFDVRTDEIRCSISQADMLGAERVCECPRFIMDRLELRAGRTVRLIPAELQIVLCLFGEWSLVFGRSAIKPRGGDCVVVPASCAAESELSTPTGGVALVVRPANPEP